MEEPFEIFEGGWITLVNTEIQRATNTSPIKLRCFDESFLDWG